MVRVCLHEPRIPQNTGNIGRTCLAFNYNLDLIYPIGFSLEDKYLRRAGLDYWENVKLSKFDCFDNYRSHFNINRIIGFSKKGGLSLDKID